MEEVVPWKRQPSWLALTILEGAMHATGGESNNHCHLFVTTVVNPDSGDLPSKMCPLVK